MRIAVLDVGGTFVKYCVMEDGRMTCRGKVPTPRTPATVQSEFLSVAEGVLETMGELDGVALSLPGVLDSDRKYVFAGGSLTYNNRWDMTEWESRLGIPLEVENDARSSATAELRMGNMQGVNCGLVLTFGTGVGGGVIVDGRVHRGAHLIAGEVSVVWADDPSLGSKAFLGSIGGVGNLAREVGEVCGRDVANGEEAFALIAEGVPGAREVLDRRCDKIVRAMFNFQCLLDPERICVGGGVSANPLFVQALTEATERYYGGFPIAFPHAEIVACRFRNDANLLGAYLHYLEARNISCELDLEGVL